MGQERRFGRRIAEPSSVQLVHELKLMALRQSLDAAVAREAAEARIPGEPVARDTAAPSPLDGR